MTNDQPDTKAIPAPYIAWQTFTGFLRNIQGKVPAQIDASVLKNLSGTARSQLLSALRFLRLIDSDGIPDEKLNKLADAIITSEWPAVLSKFLTAAYEPIIKGIDLKTATPKMLTESFKKFGGVEGGTVELSLRFFLVGMKEAGVELSPYLVVRQRAIRRPSRMKSNPEPESDEPETLEGKFQIPFSIIDQEGYIQLSKAITIEDWNKIAEYVQFVVGLRPHNIRGQRKTEKDNDE